LRFFILGTYYRHQLIWNDNNIQQSANRFDRWIYHLQEYFQTEGEEQSIDDEMDQELYEVLLDDLNIPAFLAKFDQKLEEAIKNKDKILFQKLAVNLNFIGCMPKIEQNEEIECKMEEKLQLRKKAKADRNYELADQIRKEIQVYGYDVIDQEHAVKLKKIFKSIK